MTKPYELTLYDNLKLLKPGLWYPIHNRPDYDEMVRCIKSFIDFLNEPLEFSGDYKYIRRLCEYPEIIIIDWRVCIGFREEEKVCQNRSKYREIFINDKLVAVESL